MLLIFLFFQAEDGIRDYKVTGVQTCVLPNLHERRGLLGAEAQGDDAAPARHRGGEPHDERDRQQQPGGVVEYRKSVVEGKSVDVGGGGGSREKRGEARTGRDRRGERNASDIW